MSLKYRATQSQLQPCFSFSMQLIGDGISTAVTCPLFEAPFLMDARAVSHMPSVAVASNPSAGSVSASLVNNNTAVMFTLSPVPAAGATIGCQLDLDWDGV